MTANIIKVKEDEMALALEGIKVVETATAAAGPMCGRLLADWGADVIHIEHPQRGEMARATKNSRVGALGVHSGRIIHSDIDYHAENHNCNKRGITLDLSQEDGRKIVYKLLEKADVFLSNYRPRELEKFKLEYNTLSQLNPRLIHADITGYGSKGPNRDAPGYDFLAFWARSGMQHIALGAGTSPFIAPLAAGDRMSSLALACGIMAALFVRERTGIGQEVDVSLFHTGVFALAYEIGGALVTGQDLQQVDRKEMLNAAATFYQTKDRRWLRLGMVQADPYWSRLCQAIERKDLEHDTRFDSYEPRTENHAALFKILEKVFMSKTSEEWKIRLTEAGLPWALVQNLPEVINDPQARANNFFVSYDHPTYGRIEVVANPVNLSKTPATVRMPAPEFGQHTEEVLLEYGYTREDVKQFRERGVIV